MRGLAPVLELLKTWHTKTPDSPIFDSDFGFELVDERLDKGQTSEATAIFRFYTSFDASFAHAFVRHGDAFRRYNLFRRVRGDHSKALQLDPTDVEASNRLKSLPEPK